MKDSESKRSGNKKDGVIAAGLILGLVVFSTAIFFVQSWWIFALVAGVLVVVTLLANRNRQELQKCLKFLLKNLGFVAFVMACNLLFSDFETAMLVGVRLGLVILVVYNVSRALSPRQFAEGLGMLMRPLALFGMDIEAAVLTMTVALNLIPTLSQEAANVSRALRLKGVNRGLRQVLKRPQIYVQCYLSSVLRRAGEMERALLLKGYGE